MRHKRRSNGWPQLTRAGAVRLAAGVVFTLLAGWWVVKTSTADALISSRPEMAFSFNPAHPQPALNLAAQQVDMATGEVPAGARTMAFAGMRSAPLSEVPFLLTGLTEVAAGRAAEGEELLREARRRNPRQRTARLFLLNRYLVEGRLEDAAAELSALRRLVPGVAEALAPQLALMVLDERSGEALIEILGRDAALHSAVLTQLTSSGADTDLILRVADGGPPTPKTTDGTPWQRQLLALLVERGDNRRALELWRRFSGLPSGSGGKGVYDGRFRGQPGAAPFNWALYSGSAGVAEMRGTGGLDVEFYGREEAEFASQVIVLSAGTYRLKVTAEGSAKGDDSRLVWTVSCRGSTEPFAALPLRDVGAAPRSWEVRFTVPAMCTSQVLRLVGVVGEFPGTQAATITEVAVMSGGAS